MKHSTWWVFGLMVMVSLLLSACGAASTATEKVKPVIVNKIEGSDFSQLVLTEKASERLGVQTEQVRQEPVPRTRTVAGVVVDPQEVSPKITIIPGKALVRVFVNDNDRDELDWDEAPFISSLDDEDSPGLFADIVEDMSDDLEEDEDEEETSLYLYVDNEENNLELGQRVLVEFTYQGSEIEKRIIPYAAVIYGVKGETWVYVNTEPLTFIRQLIVIDYIDGDLVVLKEGPEKGTSVVTVGVAELFGAETGVSK